MTTERYKRCEHCGAHYVHQSSGGCTPKYNHGKWCHDCYKVVQDALTAQPRQYECRYQSTSGHPRLSLVTVDKLLGWEILNRAEQSLPITRIFSGLYDLKSQDSQSVREIRGRDQYSGISFKLAVWKNNSEKPEIEAAMEYDIQQGCFTGRAWSTTPCIP